MELLGAYTEVILLGLILSSILLMVLVVILWMNQNRMRRNYRRLLNGGSPANIEELLIRFQDELTRFQHQLTEQGKVLDAIQEKLRGMKGRIGIHRYNAFAERGMDLSFSIAILNEQQDGVVLTGIHNREETYLYAKPIERGESKYNLSPEEKEAIIRSS